MRTTLTLDDDVAVLLERIREKRKAAWKEVVNDALRRGLKDMNAPPRRARKPFHTKPLNLGRCYLDNLDNIGEVLAFAEGEDHR
ncbi:MAG: DUF2191 domain-containing protein [Acidobacteria bacterium]|nr:DUF2191 domain-containing protein [Acidobacteriota bacterium]